MNALKTNSFYDVIIIGAGIGGLFSAAKLSKEGKKVLILEQNPVPGGYATVFKRGPFTFESGLHSIDGLFGSDNCNVKIFDELDIRNNISLIRIPEFYNVCRNDFSFKIPDNMENAQKLLEERFPSEKKSIQSFFKTLINLHREIITIPNTRKKMLLQIPILPFKYPNILKHLRSSVGSYMDSKFKNEDLKIALTANTGYYHDDPYEYSTLHFMGAQASYLHGGCAYIREGSYKLSEYLVSYIKRHKGDVRFKCHVDKILFNKNHTSGVSYHNGSSSNSETEHGRYIIANAEIPSILSKMIPGHVGKRIRKKLNSYKFSHSIFSLYLGLKKPLREIGNKSYANFILPDELKKLKDMAHFNQTDDFSKKILALVDYSLIDPFLTRDNRPTASCAVIDEIDLWQNLSRKEYKERKESICKILINRLEKFLPGFKDNLACYEAATPCTMKRYTLNSQGCVCGYAQTPGQVGLHRPDIYSGIKGLYFASAWSKPGGGITPAAKCGYNAACEILKKL